jgi:hypothetical protein
MLRFLQDAADLFLGQDYSHQRQPSPQVGFDHDANARKSRRAVMSCHFD